MFLESGLQRYQKKGVVSKVKFCFKNEYFFLVGLCALPLRSFVVQ
jgi:hypothetical protein